MIAIAVDDEVLMLGALVAAIKASPDISDVYKFSGCEEALEFVKENIKDEQRIFFAISGNTPDLEMCRDVYNRIHAWKIPAQ